MEAFIWRDYPILQWRSRHAGSHLSRLCTLLVAFVICDVTTARPVVGSGSLRKSSARLTQGYMEDCDWTGMTKPSVLADGSVQQEYLGCAAGRINWLYPEGAVRLTIHPPVRHFPRREPPSLTKSSKSHQVCLTVDQETLRGVNIYLQEKDHLRLVFAGAKQLSGTSRADSQTFARTDRSVSLSRRCYTQSSSVVTVYLESFPVEGLNFILASSTAKEAGRQTYTRIPSGGAAEIAYDIRPTGNVT